MAKSYQAPLPSGFTRESTASEVVAGLDLSGKTAIVTGGYSGVGIETAAALAAAGAKVVVPARRPDAAQTALGERSGDFEIAEMDLADLGSVHTFASAFVGTGRPLHMLVNNAGIMACPEARVGPGWEAQFGTNHMGHFALTKALKPALDKADGARVVALSSTAHKMSPIRWDDMQFTNEAYDKWVAYGQAKTANSLFALGVDARWAGDGIRGYAVHPGGIFTPLQRHLPKEEMIALGWLGEDGEPSELAKAGFKTPEQGGATAAWAATDARLAELGGVYCEDVDIATLSGDEPSRYFHVEPHAVDEAEADKLWDISERLLAEAIT